MENLQFQFPGGSVISNRAHIGVVGSGDLEVLLEPGRDGHIDIAVSTSVNGMSAIWQAQLERIFASRAWPAVKVSINDFGATPAVVRLRLEQALECAEPVAEPDAHPASDPTGGAPSVTP